MMSFTQTFTCVTVCILLCEMRVSHDSDHEATVSVDIATTLIAGIYKYRGSIFGGDR